MKTLYICEQPYSGRKLAKNLAAINPAEEFESHSDYLESESNIIGWSCAHLFQLRRVPGMTDDANLMGTQLSVMCDKQVLCPDWPFETIDPTYFKNNGRLLPVLKTLIHRPDVDRIVHAGDVGPDGEIIIRVILHMANADKPVYRLPLLTTSADELKKRLDEGLPSIESSGDAAAQGFRNMYFNFRRGNVQLHLGDTPLDQSPTNNEEGIAKTLRTLTSGRCCSVCKQRDVCLDTGDTGVELCTAFSPNEKFMKLLRHYM